jgi:hypothetical protein
MWRSKLGDVADRKASVDELQRASLVMRVPELSASAVRIHPGEYTVDAGAVAEVGYFVCLAV